MQTTAQLCSGSCTARIHPGTTMQRKLPTSRAPLGRPGSLRVARRPARRNAAVRAHLENLEGPLSHAAQTAADSLPSLLDNLSALLTTKMFLLANAAPAVLAELADALPDGAVDPAAAVDAATDAAAKDDGGFFGFFANTFEAVLKVLDTSLENLGIPYSYGFAIIVLTALVKLGTYPLTKKQVESTLALQALQPKVKELQAKFAGDNERLQVETAKLYQTAGVNPLAGCLPTLVTIPVFIGLYRALSNVADEGLLTEGFFWIPSLAGPTELNGGMSWLLPSMGGAPPLGWQQTIAYLVLPVLLIVSQYISQKIISPQQNQTDPSQAQVNTILKFMPFLIGWFSLNVPSGLTLYWFANNVFTTAQQAYLRNKFKAPELPPGALGETIVNPVVVEEKRPTGKDLNARRSSKQLQPQDSGAGSQPSAVAASSGGGGAGEKFRAIKAREAAKKAAAAAAREGGAGEGTPAAAAGPARGSKFRELKAKEAAARGARAAAGGGEGVEKEGVQAGPSSSNGSAPAPAAASAESAPSPAASVAVVEPSEVIEPDAVQHTQHTQHAQQGSGEKVIAEVRSAPAPAPAVAAPKSGKKSKKGKKK